MERDYLLIVLFFFRKKFKLCYWAGEKIRDVMHNKNLNDQQRLAQVLYIIEQCGFAETAYKLNKENMTMERWDYSEDWFAEQIEYELNVQYRVHVVEADIMDGSITIELILN